MGGNPQPSDTALQYLWSEENDDGRTFKLAIAVALLVHALFFAIQLPEFEFDRFVDQKTKLFVVKPIPFSPPADLPLEIPRPPERRVPIPDPTPEAPEPILITQTIAPTFELPADFVFTDIPTPPAPQASRPIVFRPEMQRPVRISGSDPVYTEVARLARIEGVVILQSVIDKNGIVRDIEVIKPLPFGLDNAAVKAVQTWRFTPALLDDKPVDIIYNLTVRFGLQ